MINYHPIIIYHSNVFFPRRVLLLVLFILPAAAVVLEVILSCLNDSTVVAFKKMLTIFYIVIIWSTSIISCWCVCLRVDGKTIATFHKQPNRETQHSRLHALSLLYTSSMISSIYCITIISSKYENTLLHRHGKVWWYVNKWWSYINNPSCRGKITSYQMKHSCDHSLSSC